MSDGPSLQERYAPDNRCFGCGPANDKGLRIRSFPEGDTVVCEWQPRPEHEAWEGVLNGGVIGALFDCHSIWTATYHLMRASGAEAGGGSPGRAGGRRRVGRAWEVTPSPRKPWPGGTAATSRPAS